MKVSVQPEWANSIEHQCCILDGFKCCVTQKLRENTIGLGSVEFCRLRKKWKACNPYPDWLPWGRKIYTGGKIKLPKFFKPIDIPKRFTGKIMNKFPTTPWIASDIISFKKEWRAYILHGNVIAIYCYSDFNNQEIQELPWKIPKFFCGTIDFGLTDNNRLLPVEVNDPYAIGWYGSLSEYLKYAEFIKIGWQYMNALPEILKNKKRKSK